LSLRALSTLVVMTALLLGFVGPRRPTDLPERFDSPILAMYMTTDLVGVERMVQPDDRELRCTWTLFLAMDAVFAIVYGSLFFLLARTRRSDRRTIVWATAILGMLSSPVMAALDLGENAAIFAALHGSSGAARVIHIWSLAKWAAIVPTALAMAVMFFRKAPIDSEGRLLRVAASFFYAVTAVIASFGLFDHLILERVSPAIGVAVLLHTIAMWIDPEQPATGGSAVTSR
jgi:hypothetical protein